MIRNLVILELRIDLHATARYRSRSELLYLRRGQRESRRDCGRTDQLENAQMVCRQVPEDHLREHDRAP